MSKIKLINKKIQKNKESNFGMLLNLCKVLLQNNRLSFINLLLPLEGVIESSQAKQRVTVGRLTTEFENSEPEQNEEPEQENDTEDKRIRSTERIISDSGKRFWSTLWDNPFYFKGPPWKQNIAKCLCELFKSNGVLLIVRRSINLSGGFKAFCTVGACKFIDATSNSKRMQLLHLLVDQTAQ